MLSHGGGGDWERRGQAVVVRDIKAGAVGVWYRPVTREVP